MFRSKFSFDNIVKSEKRKGWTIFDPPGPKFEFIPDEFKKHDYKVEFDESVRIPPLWIDAETVNCLNWYREDGTKSVSYP